MKHLYLILILALTATAANSQSYSIKTAIKSGNWTDTASWSIITRTDGKQVNTIRIPSNVVITLDVNENATANVDIEIVGELRLSLNKKLTLSTDSKVILKSGGVISLDNGALSSKNDKRNTKNEQIIIGTTVKFDGNIDGQVAGNKSADKMTGTSPNGFAANALLPVTFVSFNARKSDENTVSLSWSTTDEVNNNRFEIQRSTDGINFKSIAVVFPDTDDGNLHLYKHNDRYTAKGVVYYRIRQVDFDGKEKFSSVKVLGSMKTAEETMVYVSGNKMVTIELKNAKGNVMVRLLSLNGVVVNQKNNIAADAKIQLSTGNIAPGAYVVQVSDMNGMFAKKVML